MRLSSTYHNITFDPKDANVSKNSKTYIDLTNLSDNDNNKISQEEQKHLNLILYRNLVDQTNSGIKCTFFSTTNKPVNSNITFSWQEKNIKPFLIEMNQH